MIFIYDGGGGLTYIQTMQLLSWYSSKAEFKKKTQKYVFGVNFKTSRKYVHFD